MQLKDVSDTDRSGLEMACHEAAHAVFAAYLGEAVESVTVDPANDTGLTTLAASAISPEIERRIAYAGAWGSARWKAGSHPPLAAIIASLRESESDWEAVVRTDAGLPREDERLLETLWPAVRQVAKKLFVGDSVDYAAVCAAIGLTGDPVHDRGVRASIRCGDAPGTVTYAAPGSGRWDVEPCI